MDTSYDTKRFFTLIEKHDLRTLTVIAELATGQMEPERAIERFFQRGSKDEVLKCFLCFLAANLDEAEQIVDWVKFRIIDADEAVEFAEMMRTDKERCKRALQGLFSRVA